MSDATTSPDEIERFNRLASEWWDPAGPMRPLHAMNAVRIAWIAGHLGPAEGRALLDVGCGGGLASEALADLGFDVLGIDPAADLIGAARAHAGADGPAYRVGVAEDLLAEGRRFPAVVALEMIEHVPDPAALLHTLVALVEPGGRLFLSTLNRTVRSLLVAKIGAEYVARLLPVGTHDWRQFITPGELTGMVRDAGGRIAASAGLTMGAGGWKTTRDLGVNYIVAIDV